MGRVLRARLMPYQLATAMTCCAWKSRIYCETSRDLPLGGRPELCLVLVSKHALGVAGVGRRDRALVLAKGGRSGQRADADLREHRRRTDLEIEADIVAQLLDLVQGELNRRIVGRVVLEAEMRELVQSHAHGAKEETGRRD